MIDTEIREAFSRLRPGLGTSLDRCLQLRPVAASRSHSRPPRRVVLGTLEREVAEMEAVRQRLPREFNALMA